MNDNEITISNIDADNNKKIKVDLYRLFKRFFDVIGAIVGIVILIPLTIIVKISYILKGDFHSIFFCQERIGKDGKLFKFYKFRTMIPNADEELKRLMKEDKNIAIEYKKYKKLSNDPRITTMGNLLRKSSLDEFPQFVNILFGQMSLVGPRPYLPREKKDMKKHYKNIITVKPGLTGYWQVNGRSNTDFEDRLLLDEEYIKIRSLKLDFKIILNTFTKIFKRDGAK